MKVGGQDAGRKFVQDQAVLVACQSSGSEISRALAVVVAAMAGWATSGCLADGCDAALGFVDDEAVGVGVVHDVIWRASRC